MIFSLNKMSETQEHDTVFSGNTSPEKTKSFKLRARHFLITVQKSQFLSLNIINKYLKHFKSWNYILICHHDGPSEEHYHIYVQYNNPVNLDSRYIYDCHIEKCFGTAQQCIDYCKGLDDKHQAAEINCTVISECGEPRLTGNPNTIKAMKEMTDDELDELNPMYFKTVQTIKLERLTRIKASDWHKKVKVIYITGPSGSGKSFKAYEEVLCNHYDEFDEVFKAGEFWHGVKSDGKVCIYDDFRPSDMKPNDFIKFIDYNKHGLNIKGGSVMNNYELIIITSIFHPKKIYSGIPEETRTQWLRRIEIIDLTPTFVKANFNDSDDSEF